LALSEQGGDFGDGMHTSFVTIDAPRATRQTFRVLLGK